MIPPKLGGGAFQSGKSTNFTHKVRDARGISGISSVWGACLGRLQPSPHLRAWMEPAQGRLPTEGALDFLGLSPSSGPRLRSELPSTSGGSKAAWVVPEVCKLRAMFSLGFTRGPHFPSLRILKTLLIRGVPGRRREWGLTSGSLVVSVWPLRQVPEPLRASISYCPPHLLGTLTLLQPPFAPCQQTHPRELLAQLGLMTVSWLEHRFLSVKTKSLFKKQIC